MAMDQSALLELLEALKAAGVDERIRIAAQSMYQAPITPSASVMALTESHQFCSSKFTTLRAIPA